MKGRIYCFGYLILTVCLLWTMSGCGRSASGPAFPPKEKAAKTAAKKLGWTLNPEGTKSEEKDRVLYSFHAGDLEVAAASE